MQLVIDIPEEVKKQVGSGVTYSDLRVICETIENSTPLTDILDKIRVEIEEYREMWRPKGNSIDNAGWNVCNKCIEIIYKYKAESEE